MDELQVSIKNQANNNRGGHMSGFIEWIFAAFYNEQSIKKARVTYNTYQQAKKK